MSANSKAPPNHRAAESHTMDALARAMPLVLSAFMHVGVALVILFLGIMVAATPPEPMGPPPAVHEVAQLPPVTFPDAEQPQAGRQHAERKQSPKISKQDLFTVDVDQVNTALAPYHPGPNSAVWFPTPHTPPVTIGSIRTHAHHVVFVIDCSGSMMPVFDRLRLMMLESIGKLDPNRQDFHVIFFSSGRPIEGPARRLVPATRGNKLAACKFLSEVYPRKLTDPLPALKRAFDVMGKADARPGKVIWLLTDSEFPDSEKVLQLVRARNADKCVAVYTFLYGNREAIAEKVMRTIAAETNGKFTFISGEE